MKESDKYLPKNDMYYDNDMYKVILAPSGHGKFVHIYHDITIKEIHHKHYLTSEGNIHNKSDILN